MDTPEGRARTAEAALVVVAEHPDELVRDQYVMEVADRCRLDVERLRAGPAGRRLGCSPNRPVARGCRRAGPSRTRTGCSGWRSTPPLGDEARGLLDDVLFTEDHHLRAWHTLRDADGDLHAALAAADPDVADLLARLAVEDTVDTPRDIRRALLRDAVERTLADLRREASPRSATTRRTATRCRGCRRRRESMKDENRPWPGCRGPVASLALRTVDGDGMSDLVSAAVPEGADQSVQRAAGAGRAAGGRVTLHEVFEVLEFDDVSLDRRAEIVELLARHGIELDESEDDRRRPHRRPRDGADRSRGRRPDGRRDGGRGAGGAPRPTPTGAAEGSEDAEAAAPDPPRRVRRRRGAAGLPRAVR